MSTQYRRSIQIVSDYKGVSINLYRRNVAGEIASIVKINAQKLSPRTMVLLDHCLSKSAGQRQAVFGQMLITNTVFNDGFRLRR